jgi:clan AA aspartic protease (TIGR02281 family)
MKYIKMKRVSGILVVLAALILEGCAAARFTGEVLTNTAVVAGKVAVVAAQTTGKAIYSVANIIGGKAEVPLTRRGNTFLTNVNLNRRANGLFIVDTGSSTTQISAALARRLELDTKNAKRIQCSVADGRTVSAVVVNIREVRVGSAIVYDMPAVVLLDGNKAGVDGLLGMSFLNNFIFKIDSEKGLLILQKRG